MAEETLVTNPDHPITVTDGTIKEAVEAYPFLVIDCWAEWCGPCKMIGPILESLAKKHAGEIVFAKLDVEKNPQTVATYSIRSIPNLLVFKNGNKVGDIVGAMPEEKMIERIRSFA
ncbi:MAG: thioredoxin [Desulfomonilia bacterium]|nr:thioredoxin [Desulfomonilia bacterium]